MSVTTTFRVDATTPVLAQLVDVATKGFTGSLDVAARTAPDGTCRSPSGWTPATCTRCARRVAPAGGAVRPVPNRPGLHRPERLPGRTG